MATTNTLTDGNVRTPHAANLAASLTAGITYVPLANSTLNQALDIFAGETPTAGDTYRSQYIGIGNGGHGYASGSDGIPVWKPIPHEPTHSGFYNQLPFVIRPLSDDLTATERARFRGRRVSTINGEVMASYYLRKLDLSGVTATVELRETVDGVINTQPYTPSVNDLKPTRPTITNTTALRATGKYLAATSKLPFSMTEWDVSEFQNVINVLYAGELGYAVISEMGLVAGVERTLVGQFAAGQVSYDEVIGAQVLHFLSTAYHLMSGNPVMSTLLDLGTVEPLYLLSSA